MPERKRARVAEAQHDSGSTFNKLPTLWLRSGRMYVNITKQRKWMREMLGWRDERTVGRSVLVLCWQHLTLALLTHFMAIIAAVVVSAPFIVSFTCDTLLPLKPFFWLDRGCGAWWSSVVWANKWQQQVWLSDFVAFRRRVQVLIGSRLVCSVRFLLLWCFLSWCQTSVNGNAT